MEVFRNKSFMTGLKNLGVATGLRLTHVFSGSPQCDLRDCKRCHRELVVCDNGNNVYTINFVLETLSTKYKFEQDFCVGIHDEDSEHMGPFRVCLTKTVLTHMLEVYRLGEFVNRFNAGLLKSLRASTDHRQLDSGKLLNRTRREANRVVSQIQQGLSRIVREAPDSTGHRVSPTSIGPMRALMLHGHQFREAAKGRIHWYVSPKPDFVVFGHYHRLWVFEYHDMTCIITGCWQKTFPEYPIVLFPNIGSAILLTSNSDKTFHIELFRFGAVSSNTG